MTVNEELWAIINDNEAPRNVRDAAKELQADIQCGRRLSIACMSIVQSWLGKQQRQDRYGK